MPHFPEIRGHFEESDRLSLKYGRTRPISTAILIDDDATPAERRRPSSELWYLDNAIASIILTDWALYQLLYNLGIRADAIASHSAGEFLALSAAGSLKHDDVLLEKLFALGQVLRRQEDDGAMNEFALLAAGTNRRTVSAVIAQLGVDVHVAMDNCPHQAVVGGPCARRGRRRGGAEIARRGLRTPAVQPALSHAAVRAVLGARVPYV